jgi:hypothetical protein
MQDDDGTGRRRLEVLQHCGHLDRVTGRVVVSVLVHGESARLEQRAVVFPAGVADVDGAVAHEPLEKVGADPERSRATQGLHRQQPSLRQKRRIRPEQQAFDRLVVRGNPVDGKIATRPVSRRERRFRFLDRSQQGQFPVPVVVHAHAKVHLVGARIAQVLLRDAEDGIFGRKGNCREW